MKNLINIFLEPSKVFNEQKEKPSFLLPLLLMVAFTALMTLMYFNSVDSEWFKEHQLAASSQEMSAAQIEEMKKNMPAAKVMGYFGVVGAFIGIALISSIFALYYLLAGKMTGNNISFKHGLSLTAWAGMPTILGSIIVIVGIIGMNPQTALESLNLINLDPLFIQLPTDHAWSGFAKSFSLLSFWSLFLAALGWKLWGKTSWTQAILVALVPSLIIYGGWAVYVLAKG